MEITQEHFDHSIKNLTDRLSDLVTTSQLDEKLAGLVTTSHLDEQLAEQTKALQKYTDDAFATQQELMEGHFKEIRAELDTRKDLERLDKEMEQIKKALAGQGFKIGFGK
jgi:excinuclease UvrABC helicase subunit UvrB